VVLYTQEISRKTPGCIVVLLDRSDSMQRQWQQSPHTLAEGAADLLNRLLFELCVRATKNEANPRHYFDVGVFGYGLRPLAAGEGVESAFAGALVGRNLVPLPELDANPLTQVYEPGENPDPAAPGRPVWINPVHGGRTPMCEAIATAGGVVAQWTREHPDSYPPIVINITDGLVTDEPHRGASLIEWAERLTGLRTSDGNALLLNAYLTPEDGAPTLFPAGVDGMAEPGPTLFRMSSPLPPLMVQRAQVKDIALRPGARGLVMNADLLMLAKFLEIGTTYQYGDR
jgi:hypothetical protein